MEGCKDSKCIGGPRRLDESYLDDRMAHELFNLVPDGLIIDVVNVLLFVHGNPADGKKGRIVC